MPIKPENKDRYPKDWKEISRRIREDRAGNKCEGCKIENHNIILRGEWNGGPAYQDMDGWIYNADTSERIGGSTLGDVDPTGNRQAIQIVLTVAHLDHNPENCEDENLKAWCQRCHNRYDQPHRAANRKKNKLQSQTQLELGLIPHFKIKTLTPEEA